MIRHCVMFRFNDGVSDDVKRTISDGLDQMANLPMVGTYQHGPDAGISDGAWDYVVVGDFDTAEDYQAYATDESHVALIDGHIRPAISARAAVQYEI